MSRRVGGSMPPHSVASVPSPGFQGRLTGAAGTSPISPAASILPPHESWIPCTASLACRVWRGNTLTIGDQTSLQRCRVERHLDFLSPTLWFRSLGLERRICSTAVRSVPPPAGRLSGQPLRKPNDPTASQAVKASILFCRRAPFTSLELLKV